jgi:galactose mutarotase-like enzyme
MTKLSWTLLDWFDRESHPPTQVETDKGNFEVYWDRLHGARSEGVEMLRVNTGPMEVTFLPSRGMGIWKISCDGIEIGWNSPTRGPVHPHFVPIFDPSGIGWLEGFDELLVRCGLQSNGAPQFNAQGQLQYPLHGRIANLPVEYVELNVDTEAGEITIETVTCESRFLIYDLRIKTTYRLRINSRTIDINDTVMNASARPSSMQLLYHINIGRPVLEGGSHVYVPTRRVVPRNAHAAKDAATWNSFTEPVAGYQEQVYFTQPIADSSKWTTAVLTNAAESLGVSVSSRTDTLPYFVLWKNTVAERDGYVTGLEPATGFPNARSFEEEQQRVVPLAPGEQKEFCLQLEILMTPEAVAEKRSTIEQLQGNPATIENQPDPKWCSP